VGSTKDGEEFAPWFLLGGFLFYQAFRDQLFNDEFFGFLH
jgi:hypothetical protein